MSLTNSSAIRSVKAQSTLPQAADGVSSVTRPETILEMADRICDAMFGPTAYSAVTKLNRAAEYCSDQCLIEATKDGAYCEGFAKACLLLSDLADSIDAYLVESFLDNGGVR